MFIDLTGTCLAHFCQLIIELDENNIAQPEVEEKNDRVYKRPKFRYSFFHRLTVV